MGISRRLFLKGTAAGGALAAALGSGLITLGQAVAGQTRPGFASNDIDQAIQALYGDLPLEDSDGVVVEGPPGVADDGGQVPITVRAGMNEVESISLFAAGNQPPLLASYDFPRPCPGTLATRIRMAESADVVAVIKANGTLYRGASFVRIGAAGC
ncbi:thiosulfate oxidation carrier protein SoxY [Alkalilimnicola ehrlichii]|uniref:thiosulfate oxidation carrier protein SoxY n=1 Tax=Alkalilimnicola ehrlichii TaxID=351052 RepID=UPI003BA2B584